MKGSRYVYTYSPRRRAVAQPRSRLWLAAPFLVIAFATWLGIWLTQGGASHDRDASIVVEPTPETAALSALQEPASEGEPQGGGINASPMDESAAPLLDATAAVVLEAPCLTVLHEQSAYLRAPPASLTKVVTALVVADEAEMDELVTVSVDGARLSAETDATVMGLSPGQTLSVRDLLYGMLLPSGNDAAIALAEYVSGSETAFAALMNAKAAELSLTESSFTNPHGLDDPALYTSAYDIAALGSALLDNPDLAAIVQTQSYQPVWGGGPVTNSNLLLTQYPGSLGVKTGFTDQALQTIVGAAERDGRRLIVSVLGSSDRYVDAMALLDWAFEYTPEACPAPAFGG